MRIFTAATTSLLLAGLLTTSALAERSPVATNPLNGKLSFVTSDFPSPPFKKNLKSKPSKIEIFQYDDKPLGDRTPFLLVHGLRGEYYPYFRWNKVIQKFIADERFANEYKVYMLRYDSTARLSTTVPEFRNAVSNLYQLTQQRPITVMALSMGGNLVYEGMLEKSTDSEIKLVMTLGTPFRGSPLFTADWVKYSMYKNHCFPWTRTDHNVAYDLYFAKNRNLLQDLSWDDIDKTIPDVGRFHSLLPLGPKGDLTVQTSANERLLKVEDQPFDKKKLITYSGYLLNPYMLPDSARFLETTVMAPYTMLFMKVPAHLGREHPVLKLLNKQISSTVPSQRAADRAGTKFIYQLNDGITPVTSALFLPARACEEVSSEADIAKIHKSTDVRLARVFKNVDHLTFIDGYRPIHAPNAIKDELNASEPPKKIFDWMLSDLFKATSDQEKLARESTTPNTVPLRAD